MNPDVAIQPAIAEIPKPQSTYCQRHTEEYNRALAATQKEEANTRPSNLFPVDDVTYKRELLERIPAAAFKNLEVPNPETIDDGFESTSLYTPGKRFCLVAQDFMDGGFGREATKWNGFVRDGGFIKHMAADPKNDHLTSITGSMVEGYFFDLLPPQLRKDVDEGGCSFMLDYPAAVGNYENKVFFAAKYQKALNNLRKFLAEPTVH